MNRRTIGKTAEDLTSKYLSSRGYNVVECNWTCFGGELDLVCRDSNNFLTFVEVKSIGTSHFCAPEELLTPKKSRHLLRAINSYILRNGLDGNNWSLDLVCLNKVPGKYEIRHYPNVLILT